MSAPDRFVDRTSADIDAHRGHLRMRVLRAANALEEMGAIEVDVAVSSSGEGFHVVGYFDRALTNEERFSWRAAWGDPKRVHADEQRLAAGHRIDTNWREKGENDGERQVFDTPEEALQYVEQTRWSDYDRAKALQNDGRRSLRDDYIPHTRGVQRV